MKRILTMVSNNGTICDVATTEHTDQIIYHFDNKLNQELFEVYLKNNIYDINKTHRFYSSLKMKSIKGKL